MMKTVRITLDDDLIAKVDDAVRQQGTTRSAFTAKHFVRARGKRRDANESTASFSNGEFCLRLRKKRKVSSRAS